MARAIDVGAHAELLERRVRKNLRKHKRAMERANIGAYRLYDWDIPEVRAVVDRYEDHAVVAEYERKQTAHLDGYLDVLGAAAARALKIPSAHVHLKRRRTGAQRYARLAKTDRRIEVREGPLRFLVNLDDYVDTGLFPDHRITRRWVAERCAARQVLNLFAYTGTFTCWAAHAGASGSVSVEANPRYVEWAADNLALNRPTEDFAGRHVLRCADVADFLRTDRRRYDIAIVDPPSSSTRFGGGSFEVIRDHPRLLRRVRERVREGGHILFSTNHQRFEPAFDRSLFARVEEITERTVPVDYRNPRIHRAFWFDL